MVCQSSLELVVVTYKLGIYKKPVVGTANLVDCLRRMWLGSDPEVKRETKL